MKINTKVIYNQYNDRLTSTRNELLYDRRKYEESKKYLLSKLEPYKYYIDNFTNIIYDNIKDLDRIIAEKSLTNISNAIGLSIENLRRTLNTIVQINKSINKITTELEEIEIDLINYILFKEIIYKFNRKISDEIVYKGYVFNIGSGFGHIRIKKINCIYNRDGSKRTKKRVNWAESNKLKAEILARGGTPYKVLSKEGDTIIDNGGEKWLVYFNYEWDYLWHWHKGRCSILNSQYYKLHFTKYNNDSRYGGLGNVNKLKQLVTANSPLLANFHESSMEAHNKTGYKPR